MHKSIANTGYNGNIEVPKIISGSLSLTRLRVEDIELVRSWRIDPKISQYMLFRGHITPEMQIKWFESINNINNYYFLIEFAEQKLGLTEIKRIDYSRKRGEWGIFIYDDKYINTIVPVKAGYLLLDFAISNLRLEHITATVVKNNIRALHFNSNFLFKEISSDYDSRLLEMNSVDFTAFVKPRFSRMRG